MGISKTLQCLFSGRDGNKSPNSFGVTNYRVVHKQPKPTQHLSTNQQVLVRFLESANSHKSFKGAFHPRADVLFKEAPMTLDGYEDEWQKVYHSFPDFSLQLEGDIQEQADGKIVAIVLASGTHTGAPYAFGPYPEIPITNIRVNNDPVYVDRASQVTSNGKTHPVSPTLCFVFRRLTLTIGEDAKITRLVAEPVHLVSTFKSEASSFSMFREPSILESFLID
jgi:hypothetical protein